MRGAAFAWLSTSPAVPVRWDLGHAGWSMEHAPDAASASAALPGVLDWRAASRPRDWHALAGRSRIVAVGVDSPRERARLLDAGLGDALSSHVAFVELGVRLARLRHGESSLPRSLRAGPVTLDLFHRDGRLDGRWLGLHPREFGLLWRLAEARGMPITRRQLLRDVWRIEHPPETNSLAVHVSRLRAKLAVSACSWLVETHPQGGYRLAARPAAIPCEAQCA